MSTAAPPQAQVQRWFPVVAIVMAVALTFIALPSSLNLPQTNPAQSLEYAPVPPNSNSAAPPGGNFAGLGLGDSNNLPGSAGGGGSLTPPPLPNQAQNPLGNKACVAGRQTEDPLSPPCVARFSGNNGGATYRGVTGSSINVVFYFDCSNRGGSNDTYPSSQGTESPKCGEIDDANDPSAQSKFVMTRVLYAYEQYFNDRYQTYNRKVHMWAVYSNAGAVGSSSTNCDDTCKRTDAAQDVSTLNPFAALTNSAQDGNAPMDGYATSMAQNRVVVFDNDQQPASFYQQYPGQIWGFLPSVDDEAAIYASYLCSSVFGQTTDYGGTGTPNGTPRKVGLLYYHGTESTYYDNMRQFIDADIQKDCGASFADEQPENAVGAVNGGDEPAVEQVMAAFKQENITTVVWDAQAAGNVTQDATHVSFFPEWMVLGDGAMDDWIVGRYSDQSNWPQSYVITVDPFQTTEPEKPCSQAMLSEDPSWPSADLVYACALYDNLRQLFTGIQVAGPDLTPSSMDQGFRAIPQRRSSSPAVPACFYPANNYTCVKDAEVMWWNPTGAVPGWSGNGCYAAVEGGARYLLGAWPSRNVNWDNHANKDPCNGYGGNAAGGPWVQQ